MPWMTSRENLTLYGRLHTVALARENVNEKSLVEEFVVPVELALEIFLSPSGFIGSHVEGKNTGHIDNHRV